MLYQDQRILATANDVMASAVHGIKHLSEQPHGMPHVQVELALPVAHADGRALPGYHQHKRVHRRSA